MSSSPEKPLEPMGPAWQAMLATPATFPVPTEMDGVDAAFIDAVLRRLLGDAMPKVKSILIDRAPTQGLMSEACFITVTYAAASDAGAAPKPPTELFCKTASKGQAQGQAMAFASEACFHSTVPTSAFKNRPVAYFCQGTVIVTEKILPPAKQQSLFEDMKPAHIRCVMKLLAKLHADAWRGENATGAKGYAATLMPRTAMKPMLKMFSDGTMGSLDAVWEVWADNAEVDDKAKFKADFAAAKAADPKPRLENIFTEVWYPTECPDTLVLGDIKQDNLFISGLDDDPKITFIDFGTVAWGPAVADISFLLINALPLKTFVAEWEKYLREYYDALVGFGVSGYPFEKAVKHFKGSIAAGLLPLMFFAKKMKDALSSVNPLEKGAAEPDAAGAAAAAAALNATKSCCRFVGRWAHVMAALNINSIVAAVPLDPPPNESQPMEKLEVTGPETELPIDLEEMWKIVRDFGDVKWVQKDLDVTLKDGTGPGDRVGAERVIKGPAGEATEKLVALSDEDKFYKYRLVSSPFPMHNYIGTITLTAGKEEGTTMLTWSATFEAKADQAAAMKGGVEGMLTNFCSDAKAIVEAGAAANKTKK